MKSIKYKADSMQALFPWDHATMKTESEPFNT